MDPIWALVSIFLAFVFGFVFASVISGAEIESLTKQRDALKASLPRLVTDTKGPPRPTQQGNEETFAVMYDSSGTPHLVRVAAAPSKP